MLVLARSPHGQGNSKLSHITSQPTNGELGPCNNVTETKVLINVPISKSKVFGVSKSHFKITIQIFEIHFKD